MCLILFCHNSELDTRTSLWASKVSQDVSPYQSAFKVVTKYLSFLNHLFLRSPARLFLVVWLQLLVDIIVIRKISLSPGQNVNMDMRNTLSCQLSIWTGIINYISVMDRYLKAFLSTFNVTYSECWWLCCSLYRSYVWRYPPVGQV